MFDLKSRWRELRGHVRRLLESPSDELSRWGRLLVYQIRLWRFAFKQLRRDRLLTVAGDLSFKTLLSIIPILVIFLLMMSLLQSGEELREKALDTVYEALNLHGIRQEDRVVADEITRIVEGVRERLGAAALLGFTFLFGLAINVLMTMEKATNRIWQTQRRRGFWRKLSMFWLLLTLGPAVVALAVYASNSLAEQAALLKVPAWADVIGRGALSLATIWFVLFLFYKLLPNVEVQWRAAVTGAVVAGILWHLLAKNAFDIYIEHAVGYRKVFGSLAIVPLFCLWVYVTWIFVLFGCELAYVVQNLGGLTRDEREQDEREHCWEVAVDFVALEVACLAADRFRKGRTPATLSELARITGVGMANLERVVHQLVEAGVLVGSGGESTERSYVPAREPGRIRVAEVVASVSKYMPMPLDEAHFDLHRKLRALYEKAESTRFADERDITLADLVGELQP